MKEPPDQVTHQEGEESLSTPHLRNEDSYNSKQREPEKKGVKRPGPWELERLPVDVLVVQDTRDKTYEE